jgi:hypothetical protein
MKLEVIDNFLDLSFIDILNNEFLYNTPHMWGHSSQHNGPKFYATYLSKDRTDIKFIHNKINQNILQLNTEVLRAYINIQHMGMEGEFHFDDGDITALLMITNTPKDNGGKFLFKDSDNNIQSIDFIQNRLILFQGIEHKGCAPTDNEPRITLAFKLKINK